MKIDRKNDEISKIKELGENEIRRILSNPQDLNFEKAMQIYKQQPVEVKSLSDADKKKLNRLKRKAER